MNLYVCNMMSPLKTTSIHKHIIFHVKYVYSLVVHALIKVWTERLRWHPMLRQMPENTLHQTSHVRVASETLTI